MPAHEPAAPVTLRQEVPVVGVVRVAHRVVRARPVHPLPELSRLLGLEGRELLDALAARARERREAHRLDLTLAVHAECLLDLDLHPQALTVEAVLEPLVVAAHGPVALEDVLVRAAARVMDAHRVVGGDGPVEEGVAGAAPVLLDEAPEDLVTIPELERVARDGDEIERPRLREHVRLPSVGSGGRRDDARKHHGRQEP
jgi:hypothetical protein